VQKTFRYVELFKGVRISYRQRYQIGEMT